MSQPRLSPILTRSSSGLPGGEKAHPLPDAIPEESTAKDGQDVVPETKPVRFAWLKLDMTKSEWDILIASTCLKLLLFPA